MAYNNDKPFVAKSVDQMQKEYMETTFKLRNFTIGSQFTIAEDHLRKVPLRYKMETSKKTGKPYGVYLIKINDGYITKDLSLFDDEVITLFRTLPATVTNLKGVTVANENGKWVFICQSDGQIDNAPKSNQIAASMEPAPTEIGTLVKMLHNAIKSSKAAGKINDIKNVIEMAELLKPGDALALIQAARKEGFIIESKGEYIATQV